MKLWQTESDLESLIEDFTIGDDPQYDMLIAPFDVKASEAHAQMLQKIGILTGEELDEILAELSNIRDKLSKGKYRIENGVEDIHSQIEMDLTRALGEIGKKIHSGRSRNDQVLVALNLYYRAQLADLRSKSLSVANQLIEIADKNQHILMPGYTHSQVAMVSSFGLWFASFAESLIQDVNHLALVSALVDENPLGTAAGYGNSFPLDREYTAELLGYSNLAVNSMYAQITRGKTELLIGQALSTVCFTIGKFASDVCLFSSANYGFITLPDSMTTGSSIMPHKKNPDVFELIRAKCNLVMSVPGQVSLLMNNLMSGYHRDMQALKEIIFPAIANVRRILDILEYCIPRIEVNDDLLNSEQYNYLFTVEAVNKLVKDGMPFRDAYIKVKQLIESGQFKPDHVIDHVHIGSIGNLGLDLLRSKVTDQ